MSNHGGRDEICIDNRPTGTTQLFKIKAKLNIKTISKLKNLLITDEALCLDETPKDDLLHLVFLVDTSDSFNKLDSKNQEAGTLILSKHILPFIKRGKYSRRTAPTTITVIQFSGMGSAKKYIPGTDGFAAPGLSHYKIEVGPVNIQELNSPAMESQLAKLTRVESIDGNGQLYLVLQDIAMQSFCDKLNKAAGRLPGDKCKRFLTIVTDDEWDLSDLNLSPDIPNTKGVTAENMKKRKVFDFVKSKYTIDLRCIKDDVQRDIDTWLSVSEFQKMLGDGGEIHEIDRKDVFALAADKKPDQLDNANSKLEKKLAKLNLKFN